MTTQQPTVRTIGYVRVSTKRQATSGKEIETGLSLQAQKQAITEEVERRGWQLADLVGDVQSAKTGSHRPALERALQRLDDKEFDVLMVARLDRIARSSLDFATYMDRATRNHWKLVMLDPAVDMTTPYGQALAGMAAVFAQLERDLIALRTKEGIAAKVAAGGRHGAERRIPPATERIIVRARKRGRTHRAICTMLNAEGIPTAGGGPWQPSTVAMVLRRCA
jgi:DNA invertase Pin-like site-specific DNA recombinase